MKKSKRGNIRKSNSHQYKTPQEKRIRESSSYDIYVEFEDDFDCDEATLAAKTIYETIDNLEAEVKRINGGNSIDISFRVSTGLFEDVLYSDDLVCERLDCEDRGLDGLCMISKAGCNVYKRTPRRYATGPVPESKKK